VKTYQIIIAGIFLLMAAEIARPNAEINVRQSEPVPPWTFDATGVYRPDGTTAYTFADSLEFDTFCRQIEEW